MASYSSPIKANQGIRIPIAFYDAWRLAALGTARFSKGSIDRDMSTGAKIAKLLKQETGAIGRLWDTYTGDRGQMTQAFIGGKAAVMPYFLGFHLANLARAQAVTSRMLKRWPNTFPAAKKILVQDIGCGTGAASAGLLAALQTELSLDLRSCQLELCDQSGPLLDLARSFWEALPADGPDVRTFRKDISELPVEPFVKAADGYDLRIITLGYVLNEILHQPRSMRRLQQVLSDARQHPVPTILLIVEPANQHPCRELMELRNEWIEQQWQVLYPCPQPATACPMLERSRDWCYSEVTWDEPPLLKTLDTRLKVDRQRMSTTGYVFSSVPPIGQCEQKSVVVGRPQRSTTGKSTGADYLVCNGEALSKIPINDPSSAKLRGETPPGPKS